MRQPIDLGDTRQAYLVMICALWVASSAQLIHPKTGLFALVGWSGLWLVADRTAAVVALLFGAFVIGYTLYVSFNTS